MAQPTSLDLLFREFIEEDINHHQPLVWAAQGAGVANAEGIKKRSEILDWKAMESLLKVLAYSSESEDPWVLLGLPQGMGPLPTVEMIDQRANTAALISTIAEGPGWAQEEKDTALEWRRGSRGRAVSALRTSRGSCARDASASRRLPSPGGRSQAPTSSPS